MSRVSNKLVILGLLLSPIACNSHDDVMLPCTQMARSTDHKLLIEHLEEAEIKYQVDEEGWVRCRDGDREQVQKLGRHVLGIEDETSQIMGVLVSAKDAEEVAVALVRAKISFEVHPMEGDDKFSFRWQSYQNDEALALIRDIVY